MSAQTNQPPFQSVPHDVPVALAQMPAPQVFRIASLRASESEASISLVAVAMRLDRITPWKLGKAMESRIAAIAIVTINSRSVNPATCRLDICHPLPSLVRASYPMEAANQARSGWAVGMGGRAQPFRPIPLHWDQDYRTGVTISQT